MLRSTPAQPKPHGRVDVDIAANHHFVMASVVQRYNMIGTLQDYSPQAATVEIETSLAKVRIVFTASRCGVGTHLHADIYGKNSATMLGVGLILMGVPSIVGIIGIAMVIGGIYLLTAGRRDANGMVNSTVQQLNEIKWQMEGGVGLCSRLKTKLDGLSTNRR